jgi:hypothetical protein
MPARLGDGCRYPGYNVLSASPSGGAAATAVCSTDPTQTMAFDGTKGKASARCFFSDAASVPISETRSCGGSGGARSCVGYVRRSPVIPCPPFPLVDVPQVPLLPRPLACVWTAHAPLWARAAATPCPLCRAMGRPPNHGPWTPQPTTS